MASIFTRKGEEILIDDEDLDLVSQFTWCINDHGYPWARIPGSPQGSTPIKLHSLLRPPPEGYEPDHVNCNKLDARSKNLELVTHAKNNQRKRKLPSAGIRKHRNRYVARLTVDFKEIHLGSFKTFDLALLARIIGEIRYWGEPTQQMP